MAFNTLIPASSIPPSSGSIRAWGDYLGNQKSGLIHDRFDLGGLVFDYAGEVKAELSADITEHVTEDNTFIQDQIALPPKRVTMKGLVGELVAGPGAGLDALLGGILNSLTTVNAYIGGKTPQMVIKASKAVTQVQKVTTQISGAVAKGKSLYNFFKNGSVASTRQAQIYSQLESPRRFGSMRIW
jgi:hypothetical protein